MKLSEMNTVQLSKALCELTAPIGNLLKDKALTDAVAGALQKQEGPKTVGEQLSDGLNALAPMLLGNHLEDVCAIAAALNGKTAADVKKQNGLVTVRELADCIDGDLIGFFKSFASSGRTKSQA